MFCLSPNLLEELNAKIENSTEECCGFLLGRSSGEEDTVEVFYQVKNNAEGDRSKVYEISAKDYLNMESYALEKGLIVLGIYHTHINHKAIPSELDKKFAFPGFYYLIFSIVDFAFSEVKCWIINSQRMFVEEIIKFK